MAQVLTEMSDLFNPKSVENFRKNSLCSAKTVYVDFFVAAISISDLFYISLGVNVEAIRTIFFFNFQQFYITFAK